MASPVKLKFGEKLTGRGLNSDGLQRKLKALLDELASITEAEPENIDLTSFATVRKDLIAPSLILHKDKGVKAYVACCIAELLNVYAPDAPYTASELKDIFQFFLKQLAGGLKGPDAPYYQLYHDLLASLSRTKSAVLICDLPQADDLLAELFRDFFNLAALGLPTLIEAYMSDIMAALLDECQGVPSDVVDILIAQFNTKKATPSTPAFRVAVDVCNASSDKLVRPVCQYFTDTIVQHPYSDPEDAGDDEEGGRDFETVRAAHTLVKRMHRYCPKLLLSVIPQLQEEMSVDNVQIRLLATQTLGDMFGHKQHGSELMRDYRTTWVQWIARKNDKTPAVRLAFVEGAKKLLSNVDMRADVDEAMKAKVFDPDDKIRAAVCKAYGDLDFETAAYHASEDILRKVGERLMDKKHTVRLEAYDALGKLYSHAIDEIEKGNATAIAQFGWIPARLIDTAGINPELKVLAEDVIARYILPLPSPSNKSDIDEDEWTKRLLRVVTSSGGPRVLESVLLLSGLKSVRPSPSAAFIECCLEYNGGTIDENEAEIKARFQTITKVIAAQSPNPVKVEDDLITFAKHHDRRLYKHFKTCMDLQTDLPTLVKAMSDFMKIVDKDLPSISTTMQMRLRRSSLWLINTSSIPTLLDIVTSSSSLSRTSSPTKTPKSKSNGKVNSQAADAVDPKMTEAARIILLFISKNCAQLYYPHLLRLAKEIHTNKSSNSTETVLRALAAVACLGTDQSPNDSRLEGLMMKLALGKDQVNAKYAARYLNNSRGKDKNCAQLVDKLLKALNNADDEYIVAYISALSECALYAPTQFEGKGEEILRFLLQDLIHREVESDMMLTDEGDEADRPEWCPREDLQPLVVAKCQTMRLLANHCLANVEDEATAKLVVKLLLDTLDQDGSFSPSNEVDADRDRLKDLREGGAAARSWIRLKAAKCLLRMSQEIKLSSLIVLRLPSLALVVQDFCWDVRSAFITKLTVLLSNNKISAVFNTIVFLTCHDIEHNVRERARNYVTTQLKKLPPRQRLLKFEVILVRYLHLLAHHPDYDASENEEGLPALAKYIEFYLDLVATSENVSLLYCLAQQCKTVRDKEGHTFSENLYLLSELADYAIKQRAQNNSWTIPSYPDKVNMPKDIFSSLPTAAAIKEVRTTVYLTDEKISSLGEMGKTVRSPQAKAKKRRAPAVAKSKRPTKRRKKNQSDEESDERDASDDDDDNEHSSVADPPAPTSDEDMSADSDSDGEDSSKKMSLGRGARGKAKAKAQHKAKKSRKQEG